MNQGLTRFLCAGVPLALLCATGAACGGTHAAAGPPPPIPVEVATVEARTVTLTSDYVATLTGYVNANIQPQVGGYLSRQEYREGQPVKKDQVLFEIDPRPFQAVLDEAQGKLAQARGSLAQAHAQVAQAQAQLAAATLNVRRDEPEAAAHAIPQSQLDNDTQARLAAAAAVTAAQANVTADTAAVAAAQAAVEQAQLNLGFTRVRSLIDGVAGVAQVQIGNLVSPQTVLTTVSQLDPIKAYFPIPDQDYLQSRRHTGGAVDLLTDPAAHLQLLLPDGSLYARPGRVLFADRAVDPATGTIRLAATFPNPEGLLRPGQPARVRAVTRRVADALLVPQPAVTELQGSYRVAVVGAGNVVSLRPVQVGTTVGGEWIITSGLKAGERVVSSGADKVQDGTRVSPQPAAAAGTER
ncbi:MAG: efflux RND transporter periplasmic adaptor subunit [Terriglobales bacterium]